MSGLSCQLADSGDWDGLLRLLDSVDRALVGITSNDERGTLLSARGTVCHTFVSEAPGEYARTAARLVERFWSQRRSLFT
ncbi:hypothetical protein [Streptomyces sp. NPDC058572]|uniref:hypothetical protein n=1 Tax=Streptomyces sp. NPDC058572 TaxID=3346546 RepID=UPI00365D8E1E